MGVILNWMRYANMLGTQVSNVSFLSLWGLSEGKDEKQESTWDWWGTLHFPIITIRNHHVPDAWHRVSHRKDSQLNIHGMNLLSSALASCTGG